MAGVAKVVREVSEQASNSAARRLINGDPRAGMDMLEEGVGRAVGVPLVAAGELAAKGVWNAGRGLARGVGDLAAGTARKLTPLGLQERLSRRGLMKVPELDMSNPRHRLQYRRRHGLEVTDADKYHGRSKWPMRALVLGGIGLPAGVISTQGNRGVYDDLSRAAQTGVREVTANDNSTRRALAGYLSNVREKTAARPGQHGGSFGDETAGHPFSDPGAFAVKGLLGGVGEVVKPSAQTLGYSMQKSLFPNVGHRVRAEDAVAESAVKEFGKQTGTYASGLLQGVVNSGINMGREAASWGPQRKKIFDQLMMSDPVISRADPEMVLQAYHSMKRFAPLLSTDPHAAQAFLREAVIHEGAMNYNTVGALAKAETEARRALGM